MPLVSILGELKRAQHEHYAVPLFDAFDSCGIEGIFLSAEEKKAPVIVAIYSGIIDLPYTRALAAYVRTCAQMASVPAALMLDHGAGFESCIKAISFGFTDVMYDGSKLPLEQNIANTREIVRVAHAAGLPVEAELGHVGHGADYDVFGSQRKGFTDAATVERFVAETGVDILAVAIGSAHGLYKGEPQLDFDLLRDIRRRVEIPLALHGGTGIPEDQFRRAIAEGIAKVNIFTDLAVTTRQRLGEATAKPQTSFHDLRAVWVNTFRERCGYHFDLFGATGRAK
jgi:ketose-bisphosphate aldolase